MSSYFLLGILRNLWRSKLNSLINIASLALGLAVFAFAFLYVKKELSYDRAWPDAENIHRLVVEQRGVPGSPDGSFTSINTRAYTALADNYDGHIDRIAKAFNGNARVAGSESNQFSSVGIVDPVFIELFRFEVLSGSLDKVLQTPNLIAVQDAFAETFPGGLALGSTLELESNFTANGQRPAAVTYEVGAIFRVPEGISPNLNYQMLAAMDDYSLKLYPQSVRMWNDSHQIWLKFKPEVDVAEFEALMPEFIDRVVTAFNTTLKPGERISEHLQYRFQPVTAIHLNPVGNEIGRGDMNRVVTVAALGVLVLLVGCSNSVSLSLATVLERRREIGIRKAAGALPGNILVHYLGEAVFLALLALLPALALVKLLLPPFLTLLNFRQALDITAPDYAVLAAIAALVGLLSGAYPALVLSGVKPQLVLKTNNVGRGRGTQGVRTVIIGFQFCFALTLMIATLALYTQLQVVRRQPLGFNPDKLLMAAVTSSEQGPGQGLLDELRKIPGVIEATTLAMPPNAGAQMAQSARPFINKNGAITEARIPQLLATPGQFRTLEIPLLAGREFDAVRDALNPTTGQYGDAGTAPGPGLREGRLVINRSATQALGFANPAAAVDQLVYISYADATGRVGESPVRIVGVVEDSMYASIRSKPGPEAYMSLTSVGSIFLLRFDERAADTIQDELKEAWQRVTGTPLQYTTFIEPMIASAFAVERNESRLLLYSAGLALFLSCVGLYGLAAFTMARNLKEIGVRKVLGSSVPGIARLYLWRYARPVLVASLVATPVAVYFILQWMQRFPYQMNKAWLLPLCVGAVSIVLMIALLTVSGVIVKAARSRLVHALRYE